MVQLRSYQVRIVEQALSSQKGTVVVLPTGAGKTLVAAELIRAVGGCSLFLVPTCLLVEQQAAAIRSWTGSNVKEYMGGAQLPAAFDVLVSTPKAFQIAQAKGNRNLAWAGFGLVVFDEVHHVLKDHPYRKLALQMRRSSSAPRVLGLTASLTYAVGRREVESAVRRLCAELDVDVMATASEEEMAADGYHGNQAVPEVRPVDMPRAVPAGVVPQGDRKPHLMAPTFFSRVTSGSATAWTLRIHAIVSKMEAAISTADQAFRSPLHSASVKTWGAYAHGRAGHSPLYALIESWYEALRALAVSWEEAEDAALTFLRMSGADAQDHWALWPQELQAELAHFWTAVPATFPRFENLKEALIYEQDRLETRLGSGAFRGVLFVQQRVTTHILEHVVRSDADLSRRFSTACIYATSSPATASLAVSAAQSKQRLAAFAAGRVNLLIATVVAEEGMDVPAANCTIRFDPVVNAVSLTQGGGRARQAESAHVVLSERQDRPVARLAEVQQEQLAIVRDFVPGGDAMDVEREKQAQLSRERNALATLKDRELSLATAVGLLNVICKKTKVDVEEHFAASESQWTCTLTYTSTLRSLSSSATESGKKESKKAAAVQLLALLRPALGS